MNTIPPRLKPESSLLLVIDIQDKLLAKIPATESLVKNASFLLDVASQLGVPVQLTEQYPKGLGPTTAAIRDRVLTPALEKTRFSCCGAAGLLEEITRAGATQLVLAGMETHVCVQQTVLDLLQAGLTVFVPVDAVAARHERDHEIALRRVERAGAILTTVESVAFEWLGDASHPQFKAISRLVIDRASP